MTAAALPMRGPAPVRAQQSLLMAAFGALYVAPFILLPFDWGFPRIPILGRPLNPVVAIAFGVLGLLVVRTRGTILKEFRRPYCALQTAYFALLIVESLRASAPMVALQQCLVYYSVYVLNYVILLYFARQGGTRPFVLGVVVAGLAAASIGLLQGLLGIQISAYERWFDAYFGGSVGDQSAVGIRGIGTLNNPILYGMAMVLVVPYLLEIRRLWLKGSVFFVLFVAAALTGSRTVLLVGAVFFIGGFWIYRWRMLWLVPVGLVGLLVGVQMLGGWKAAVDDPRVNFLLARVGLVEDENVAEAKGNIAIRQEALKQGAREVLDNWGPGTWLVGNGMLSAVKIGQKVSADYNTVDNAFFGIFYEKGLIGLALFLGAFIGFLRRTKSMATRTMQWWGPVGLLAAGMSFNFDAFSTFTVLAIGSMAVTTVRSEQARPRRATPSRPGAPAAPLKVRDLPGETLEPA